MNKFFKLDKNFNPKNYILQSLLGAIYIGGILLFFKGFGNKVVISSLGASTFIAFSFPHAKSSEARYLIGGYVIGGFFGVLFSCLHFFLESNEIYFFQMEPYILLCAIAVFCSMLIMVSFNFEHPPAVALSFSLILEKNSLKIALLAVISVSILCLFKNTIKKYLINLQ